MTHDHLAQVKWSYRLVTSISVIFLIYNIQFLVFPAYQELRNRSNERFAKASLISHGFQAFFYILFGLLAILILGPGFIKDDFLENLGERSGPI